MLVFTVRGQGFGLPLSCVRSVVAAVAVTPLPGAPEGVLGFFDLRGTLVPVLDAFARTSAGLGRIRASQQFLILDTGRRVVALVADAVSGVQPMAALEPLPMAEAGAHRAHMAFAGVVRQADGLVLIHDMEHFLTQADGRALDAAFASLQPAAPTAEDAP